MYSQCPLSDRGASDVISVFGYLKMEFPCSYDDTNKVLSHISGVPVKLCLPSKRAAYSEMCRVRCPNDTVEEL
jgi:hypothetical protein